MNATSDLLSDTFAALSDPTRRAILARLADGEATVNELAEPFPVTVQAVSKHLKVLEKAGLVMRGHRAQWRPCRLQPEPLRAANLWLEEYRHLWEQRFDQMETFPRSIQDPGTDGATPGSTEQDSNDHMEEVSR